MVYKQRVPKKKDVKDWASLHQQYFFARRDDHTHVESCYGLGMLERHPKRKRKSLK